MLGFVTVREGERIAVWDKAGRMEFVDGPRRMFLFRKTVEKLTAFRAHADQYLAVEYADGHCDYIKGPAVVWWDPVQHKNIEVADVLAIDSHEAVVVYQRRDEKVDRRVIRGPAQYVPTEDEWLHEFTWHGADPKDHHRKIPRALNFVKLWVIPDQMYFDVQGVRTADDALLTIKLMVFFELVEIEIMLDETHDPIADFINAVSADVIDYVGVLSFEQFKEHIDQLNDLATYANLTRRAARIGYKINKVVYRGYTAGEKLQMMHDNAIEARTGLKLEAETEEQAQELADLKLQREGRRAQIQRELEQQQAEHKIRMDRLSHDEQLRQLQVMQDNDWQAKKKMNELELEHAVATNNQKVNFLKAIQELQVDLTSYLVAQYQNPDKLIRIDSDNDAQLHLHEN